GLCALGSRRSMRKSYYHPRDGCRPVAASDDRTHVRQDGADLCPEERQGEDRHDGDQRQNERGLGKALPAITAEGPPSEGCQRLSPPCPRATHADARRPGT